MFEKEKMFIEIEETTETYDDFFEQFNIETNRREKLKNTDILFVPKYYRNIEQPCFTEGLSNYFQIIRDELNITNIDLCKKESDSYKEFQMHSSTIFLGTILTGVAVNVISKILCDAMDKQCTKDDEIINVNIINPTINVSINYNDTYENFKKLPDYYETYTKTGSKKVSLSSEGQIINVTA